MTLLGRVRRFDLRRVAFLAALMLAFLLVPIGSVQAAVPGCEGEPAPQPEAAGSGSDDGKAQNLGDFAVTMVKEGGGWRVYDFQPADAGNLGGG